MVGMKPHGIVNAVLICVAVWSVALCAQDVGAAARPNPSASAAQAIPPAVLDAMYRRELGDKYHPVPADSYYQAHLLIERYFVASATDERKTITQAIEATGIDANILGRLTRLRVGWPELAPGLYYVNERFGPHEVRYFLGVPKGYDRAVSWPLVIKLPTAHAFLTDPPPGADQVARIYGDWITDELTKHPDALVLMPLLNLDELYGPSYAGMNSVIQPMQHAFGRVNLDPARVYLIGHAMSGHAVWNLALHYGTYLAAINPLAGAAGDDWQRLRLMNLSNVLPVVWHDSEDLIIPVESSRSLMRVLRQLKIDAEYEETKGVGNAPSEAIAERAYQKLRARIRSLYPPQVRLQSNRPDALFNRLDWVQLYQPMNAGPEQRLLFRHGSGNMVVYQNSFRIEASFTGPNAIQATTDNVESMRFHLNDQLIDFAKPLTITVNRKVRFEGMLKPSIDEMLKDQLFLGRGWRYFTAVVDVDFAAHAPGTRPTTQPSTRRGVIEIIPPEGSTQPVRRIEVR